MEPFAFLAGAVIVMLILVRGRVGGSKESPAERLSREAGRPLNYGEFVAPPGTGRGSTVNAPFFRRDQAGAESSRSDSSPGDD